MVSITSIGVVESSRFHMRNSPIVVGLAILAVEGFRTSLPYHAPGCGVETQNFNKYELTH
jgi:hypothetical protein